MSIQHLGSATPTIMSIQNQSSTSRTNKTTSKQPQAETAEKNAGNDHDADDAKPLTMSFHRINVRV